MNFIDTHCHIIHGVDDGPSDVAESLALARQAAQDGIVAMVATPHVVEGGYMGADLGERLAHLQEMLADNGIGIELFAGAEVPMSICLTLSRQELGRLAIAGSRYLLMETAETTFDQLARAAYQVRLRGFYPILAHPERTEFVRERPEKLADIILNDQAFCQITAASIEGRLGKSLRRASHDLLKRSLVHLVASDAHGADKRPSRLSGSYEVVSALLGEPAARTLVIENPQRVLQNAPLESINTKRATGFLSRFRRRR